LPKKPIDLLSPSRSYAIWPPCMTTATRGLRCGRYCELQPYELMAHKSVAATTVRVRSITIAPRVCSASVHVGDDARSAQIEAESERAKAAAGHRFPDSAFVGG